MKAYKFIMTMLVLSLCFKGIAQSKEGIGKKIIIGEIDSLYSDILKEYRHVWMLKPNNFDATKKYPVIYVLDGSKNFSTIVGMMKHLAPFNIPESIIVGITNTDRTRDFTPTNVKFQRGRNSETSGGANNFVKFLDNELKPFINSKYPTENNNTIIGHSSGGLLVLYAFLNHENVFDNYLAIDPSLWWDKEQLVKMASDQIRKGNRKEKSLYIAVANSLGKAMDTVKVRKDRSVSTEQIRANLKFHDILVDYDEKLNFIWEYYENEDHGSIVVPAQYNGLRSVFSWFPFHEMWRFNIPKKYSAKQLTEPYYKHYGKLSKRLKRKVKPDWQLINDVGSYLLEGHKLHEKALAFFEMNLDFYPEQSKSYVTLGNYYALQKEKAIAIEYYKKAIEIDGNLAAQAKLSKLKE
ncbi:alpha/beta hydrolase-fold protein [Winogradskyella sp. PG-2]|uniref:alpha/beta hydrolase-fold protein n=1 Tax=Winogradskyella sp. PG-2 TaxID=754409 RepID=UPI0004587F39|nr:alpha/beta hydrolase-fold protein [Winogradskyella sp. PG-2]BAO77659.1 putative esterase [Winogradskyella sp. PG-2]